MGQLRQSSTLRKSCFDGGLGGITGSPGTAGIPSFDWQVQLPSNVNYSTGASTANSYTLTTANSMQQ